MNGITYKLIFTIIVYNIILYYLRKLFLVCQIAAIDKDNTISKN